MISDATLKVESYFTSDLHLFHERSIEFDDRPFSSISDMHEGLRRRWNATVSDMDIVYVLGDLHHTCTRSELREYITSLNGNKVLILGNHDKKSPSFYMNCGFNLVLNSASMVIGGVKVNLTHCPPRGHFREDVTGMRGAVAGELWHGESRHFKFSVDYRDDEFFIHGHTHKQKKERTLGRLFDVGVVANDYTPVSSRVIEGWIAKRRKYEKDKN